jgi:hypothetical protein
MTNLTETSSFDAGVYQIATTDNAIGGAVLPGPTGGIANFAAQNLTNRTRWLYNQVNSLSTSLAGLAPNDSPLFTGSPRCPSPPVGDGSSLIPNTAWVNALITTLFSNVHYGTNGSFTLPFYPHPIIVNFGQIALPTGNGDVISLAQACPNGVFAVFALDFASGCQNFGWTPNTSDHTRSFLGYSRNQVTGALQAGACMGWVSIGW